MREARGLARLVVCVALAVLTGTFGLPIGGQRADGANAVPTVTTIAGSAGMSSDPLGASLGGGVATRGSETYLADLRESVRTVRDSKMTTAKREVTYGG